MFGFDERGYLKDWLVAGPIETPYSGPDGTDAEMSEWAPDKNIMVVPEQIQLGSKSPLKDNWHYVWSGNNPFVEFSTFHFQLETVEFQAAVHLIADKEQRVSVHFWAAGMTDLFCNGQHIARKPAGRNNYPIKQELNLVLKEGCNQLYVRSQILGLRDTRQLFGLQFIEANSCQGLKVELPGWDQAEKLIKQTAAWLNDLRILDSRIATSTTPPPIPTELEYEKGNMPWPSGKTQVEIDNSRLLRDQGVGFMRFTSFMDNIKFCKSLVAQSPTIAAQQTSTISEDSIAYLMKSPIANPNSIVPKASTGRLPDVLCRHLLNMRHEHDSSIILEHCKLINSRPDCSDFWLSMLLRMYTWKTTTEEERQHIKKTALDFRYWEDEPGTDTMCMSSENHSLLFHSCQRISGILFPDERFSNSGRTGNEQAQLGLERCHTWFDKHEATGLAEFNSATYMPITLAALLNTHDLCRDEKLTQRAAKMTDIIYNHFASHSFHGVTTSPQGRVYNNVLIPESSGAQAILSTASNKVLYAFNAWMCFPLSSTYRPPNHLEELITQPQSLKYQEGPAYIHLEKSEHFCLSSLELPNPKIPQEETHHIFPEAEGYQQHTAHATLGPDCHVFVNHPGGFYDGTFSRPGYWYGHTSIPYQLQEKNKLTQLFILKKNSPINFTHIHWPSDIFDEQFQKDHWLVSCKDGGCIAVWCSRSLKPHNDRLIQREFRAHGTPCAYVWICDSLENHPGNTKAEKLNHFLDSCKSNTEQNIQAIFAQFKKT